MQTILQQPLSTTYDQRTKSVSALSRFFSWADKQESSRFGWVAGILALHGCVLTPITVFIVAMTGMNFALFMTAIVAMGIALTTNLAAMPTKVTIPVFFLSALIDLIVIAACFFI